MNEFNENTEYDWSEISVLDSLCIEPTIYEFNFPATTKQLQHYINKIIKNALLTVHLAARITI